MSGWTHGVRGFGPNDGKGLTQPFSAVRTDGSLDFGKANLRAAHGVWPAFFGAFSL